MRVSGIKVVAKLVKLVRNICSWFRDIQAIENKKRFDSLLRWTGTLRFESSQLLLFLLQVRNLMHGT
jgi:hypothetical protein